MVVTITHITLGVILGLACLIPARGKSLRGLANMAYVYFAAMVFVYFGAYLVTGDLSRLAIEGLGIFIASGFAVYFKSKWPYGMALMVLLHGFYDLFFGHSAGVMDWYPAACAGFDITAGLGFLILMKRAKTLT